MPSRHLSSVSLATRYTVLATIVIIITTVLLGVSAAAGVYQMATAEQSARQRAYREIVGREVTARLQASFRVLLTLSEHDVLATSDPVVVRRALTAAMVDNAGYLQRIALVEASGTVVSAYPSNDDLTANMVQALVQASTSEKSVFVWQPAPGDVHHDLLWVVVPAPTPEGGAKRYLAGEVRTEALSTMLEQVSETDRSPTVYITDKTGVVEFSAGSTMAIAAANEAEMTEAADGSSGSIRLSDQAGGTYRGVYSDILELPGLGWRVVVLETADVPVRETLRALMPAWIAWIFLVVLCVGIAVVAFTWLARPLRTLETRARAAAAGAMLEPIAVDRGDEVGRLLESFNLITMRLNRMHDVSQILARSSDSDEVLDGIVASMAHMLGASDVDIVLLDDSRMHATIVRAIGSLEGRTDLEVPVEGSDWLRETLRSGDAEVFARTPGEDALMALHASVGKSCCGLAVPLVKGSDVLGIVAIVFDRQRSFTHAEVELARSFAAQASVALDNARLFDEERRSRREAEVLRRVAESLTAVADVREALSSAASIEAELLGMDVWFVALVDQELYGAGPASDSAVETRWLQEWERVYPETVTEGLRLPPVWMRSDSGNQGLDACVRELKAQAALLTPLFRGETFAGLLILGSAEGRTGPTRRQVSLADTIGKEAGLALENAYLFEQARSRADNLETVFRISQAVSSSLENKVVLSRVLDVVQKIFSADAVMLMTYDRDRKSITVPMARGLLARDMLEMEFKPGEDIPGRVFESKEPERLDELERETTPLARVATSQGLRSAMVTPLLARGRSIGVLATLSKTAAAFTDDDTELLRTFASQGALAIDTANLFSREHHVATVLQESILPTRLPQIPGLDASSVYVPAGSEAEIGGDYYDVFLAPDGRLAVAMGDVCGKGVEAATKTSMIKYSIRGMVAAGLGPARVLEELNTMIVDSEDPANIVTMWLAFLDIDTGGLVWANGGHPPALLLHPETGEITRLGTTGALLGAVGLAHYSEESTVVGPGGVLLLFTDGVTEARNKGRFFGEGRVRRALRPGGSAAVVTQRLLSLVQRFAAGDLRDDAAILTLVRLGEKTHVSHQ